MIDKILAYQKLDEKLYDIEVKLSSSEERKKAINAKKYIDSVDENIDKLDTKAQDLCVLSENLEKNRQLLLEQENELKSALETCQDKAGADFIIKKIEELSARLKSLRQEAERIEEETKNIIQDYAKIKNTLVKAKKQYEDNAKLYNEQKDAVKEERGAIKEKLDALANDIDSSLINKYQEKRAKKIFPIIYEVENNVCGFCKMELPSNIISKLKGGEIMECDQCGRLIYKKK